MQKHALFIQTLVKSLGKSEPDQEDLLGKGQPLDGGPKTAEPPPAPQKNTSLSEIDISSHLNQDQADQMRKVVEDNKRAFGLGNRLGSYPAKVTVRLKPDSEPISLPPFPQSPVKREVMDKQIDDWLQLEVIEPSVSPWGAPTFIVYRNDKPRMVIDYRKLNEQVIPDEFPLPKHRHTSSPHRSSMVIHF